MTAAFTSRELLTILPKVRLLGCGSARSRRVHTDTRTLQEADLFVALRGDNFNANEKISDAFLAGASIVLADDERLARSAKKSSATQDLLVVDDARYAMGDLAMHWRKRFEVPVIAVTGSNGKTTVKEMIAQVLKTAFGDLAFATLGNLNNDVGVPQTLFRLNGSERVAVIELGMNHAGEIARLAQIVAPTVALVNNAQREHQEFMKSVTAVALENGAVLSALPPTGTAVFPGDDPFTPLWKDLAGQRKTLTFGYATQTGLLDLWATPEARADSFVMHYPGGQQTVSLSILGRHNVRNALAAAACCHAVGIEWNQIFKGLEAFRPVNGRLCTSRLTNVRQTLLVDDTYNANPDSVLAAIALLAECEGPHALVLGDMGEVGDQGPLFHQEIGRAAEQAGVSKVLVTGELAKHVTSTCSTARHYETIESLINAIGDASEFATILVKGSRFMRMERVVHALQEPR